MAKKVGFETKLYIQTDGVGGNDGWTAVTLASNITKRSSRNQADASSRVSSFAGYMLGQIQLGIDVEAVYDSADTQLAALRTAHLSGAAVGVAALDAAAGLGPKFDAIIAEFEVSEPLDDTVRVSMTLVPDARSATVPTMTTEAGIPGS